MSKQLTRVRSRNKRRVTTILTRVSGRLNAKESWMRQANRHKVSPNPQSKRNRLHELGYKIFLDRYAQKDMSVSNGHVEIIQQSQERRRRISRTIPTQATVNGDASANQSSSENSSTNDAGGVGGGGDGDDDSGGDDDPDADSHLIHFLTRTDDVNEADNQSVQPSELDPLVAQLKLLTERLKVISQQRDAIQPHKPDSRLKHIVAKTAGVYLAASFLSYGLSFASCPSLDGLGAFSSIAATLIVFVYSDLLGP